ncbi:MAG: c-type cytochrome domain-containing protein [Planctomycetota bacterium]
MWTCLTGLSRWRAAVVTVALLTAWLTAAGPATAASIGEQRAALKQASTDTRTAARLARAGKLDEAAEQYRGVKAMLSELAQAGIDPKLDRLFSAASKKLDALQEKLAAAGVDVGPKATLTPSLAPRGQGAGRFDQGQVSFVRDVAPMLAAKCGACHIDGKRGGFSLASYQDLMRGTEGVGRVLVPGDGATSHIVELIASGDMPRGGGRVTPAETQKLVAWITQGAKFDGDSETASLRSLRASAGTPPPAAAPAASPAKVSRPTGGETVSFAMDVAPILAAKCLECHGRGNPRAGLSLLNFRGLLRGGDSGRAVAPSDPDASGLVHRITGEEMPRMPLRRPPLSPEEIRVIRTWVKEGAKFDGGDPAEALPRVYSLARAERATPEELSGIRRVAAAEKWRLAAPRVTAASAQTDRFYVLGNLPEARLTEIGAQAESLADAVATQFGGRAGEPFQKARVTLYAFAERIDYSEFRLMVDRVEAPRSERGAHGYDVVDAYAAVQLGVAPSPNDEPALAEQIAAVYLAEKSQGRLPAWFIDGAGKAAAAEIAPKSDAALAWRESAREQALRLKRPADIFGDRLAPEAAGVLRFAFIDALLRRPSKVQAIVAAVEGGSAFDAAFAGQYGRTPEELAPLWAASVNRRR